MQKKKSIRIHIMLNKSKVQKFYVMIHWILDPDPDVPQL